MSCVQNWIICVKVARSSGVMSGAPYSAIRAAPRQEPSHTLLLALI